VSDDEPTPAQPVDPSAAQPPEDPTAQAPTEPTAQPPEADAPEPQAPSAAEETPTVTAPETTAIAETAEAGANETGESAEAEAESAPSPSAGVQRRRPSGDDAEAASSRVKPAVPGADLEVDIVPEGADPLARHSADPYAVEDDEPEPVAEEAVDEETSVQPIEQVAIDLAAGARYRATGKRKTAIARVTLQPGTGAYTVNGKTLNEYFPRPTLQRNIRQPLETVGFQDRMDVIARLHGGGVSAQGGALRHGISRALLEADPNLRGELKRRGFLTRDARAKERKKAGLKKARKRPQFSKR
jgi:small subunit ribosomal protein S9